MERIDSKDWFAKAKGLFGNDDRDWRFACCACGNVQSINGVVGRKPDLKADDVAGWIHFSCEGRHNPARGCNWTLGGLFHFHTLEVMADGQPHATFRFDGEKVEGHEPFYTPRQDTPTTEKPHAKVA